MMFTTNILATSYKLPINQWDVSHCMIYITYKTIEELLYIVAPVFLD